MSNLILFTSGSTDDPKEISHPWEFINSCAKQSVDEIKLTSSDIVLDVFPGNTIAHYTVTALPARIARASLISANFNPYTYIELFNKYRPTYISLIPKHWDLLSKTKGWDNFDMSCVRYMVTGSGTCSQTLIDSFLSRGVQLVANWYGMTEMPPPVFIGYNSETFDFDTAKNYNVEFDNGECVIDGWHTGDIFDVAERKFLKRKDTANGKTWKSNV
jgi:acyl-coenzyme A synthetase/AMP-(fatty) acid ligase